VETERAEPITPHKSERGTRVVEDLAALCACGGRFAGREQSAGAGFLAGRMAEATGASVRRGQVPYRGWTRGPASIVLPGRSSLPALGLMRKPSTPSDGVSARLIDLIATVLQIFQLARCRRSARASIERYRRSEKALAGRYPRCSWHEDSRGEYGLGVKPAWRSCLKISIGSS